MGGGRGGGIYILREIYRKRRKRGWVGKGELPSWREYKREDVLGSGRNPNGIGNGNRSGRTTVVVDVRG